MEARITERIIELPPSIPSCFKNASFNASFGAPIPVKKVGMTHSDREVVVGEEFRNAAGVRHLPRHLLRQNSRKMKHCTLTVDPANGKSVEAGKIEFWENTNVYWR